MRIGIPLRTGPRNWVAFAKAAEDSGFEFVWTPEHLILPVEMSGHPGHPDDGHPPIPSNMPVWDAWVLLAYLAAHTRTIRLGVNVYNIGLRHPFVTARAVATADLVSGGRIDFGIGASWLAQEWRAMELDFATRSRRVNESIAIIKRLFTEDVVEHEGEFFKFQPVQFEPKPVQRPWPPMLIGGDAPAAMRRATQHGDGWLPMEQTLETLPASLEKIARLRAEAGRTGPFEISLQLAVTPSLDDLKRYRDLGVHRLLLTPWSHPREAVESMKRFGGEVLPQLA